MRHLKKIGLAAMMATALMVVVGASAASGAELYKATAEAANDTQGAGTEITATLKSGTSLLLKDTLGGANDTCTSSEVKGKVESAGSSTTNPSGKVSTLSFGGCSHTTDVLANGSLEITNIAGTTNGTVISKGARVTVKSTIFGISCVVHTDEGTTLGTLTGAKAGESATLDVNSVVNLENGCGDSYFTGTYLVTSPTGLVVDAPSGAELYKATAEAANDTQGAGTEITATLKSGTSLLLKDTIGGANDTCTSSEVKGKVESAGSSTTNPSGKVSTLSFGGCSHTTDVLANGSLEITNIAGTTNGTVISKGARVTVKSTIFGISCVVHTDEGTTLGTLTGAKAGESATLDVNSVVNLENGCGDSYFTGTYLVTSPTGLVVDAPSGAELYKATAEAANDTQGAGTEITATLKSGTSLLLKDTIGGANDTCTSSEVKGKVESAGSSTTNPSGKVSTLSFGGCSHTTDVLANGSLEITNIAGTTNGTVISKGARVTVKSTIFGISCVVHTDEGTTLGTLTGAKAGESATLDVNSVVNLENGCGDSYFTGTYLVTSPTGLVVEGA